MAVSGRGRARAARLHCVNCQPQKCAKKEPKNHLFTRGRERGVRRVYKQRLYQHVTSPHRRRRRRRRADFNLKCSCFCKSLFASLSQLSTFPLSLSLRSSLTVSVVSANLFCTQIRVGYAPLLLYAHRTRVIVWLSSFSLSLSLSKLC